MSYNAELTIAVTFHNHQDLTQYLAAARIPPVAEAEPRELAWAILAGLSEYATGTLDGLHLVGRGTGRLLHEYPQLVGTLARHANGTITAIAEDGSRWQHQLTSGQAITFPDGASHPEMHLAAATLANRTSHGCSGRSRKLASGAVR